MRFIAMIDRIRAGMAVIPQVGTLRMARIRAAMARRLVRMTSVGDGIGGGEAHTPAISELPQNGQVGGSLESSLEQPFLSKR